MRGEVPVTEHHGGKITGYVVAACIVAFAAGLILGYHLAQTTGVMSRILELEKAFPWKESDEFESTYTQIILLFMSSTFLTALYYCPLASYFTRSCGRKSVLITSVAYFLSSFSSSSRLNLPSRETFIRKISMVGGQRDRGNEPRLIP